MANELAVKLKTVQELISSPKMKARLAAALPAYRADGVLTGAFLLNNAEALLAAVRDATVCLRVTAPRW